MKKYNVITIIIVALFLSVGIALACEPQEPVNPCDELTKDVAPDAPCGATETPTPMVEGPTATPGPGNVPENPSDHLSDGKSSCPECTAAPKTVVIPQVPNTGRGL